MVDKAKIMNPLDWIEKTVHRRKSEGDRRISLPIPLQPRHHYVIKDMDNPKLLSLPSTMRPTRESADIAIIKALLSGGMSLDFLENPNFVEAMVVVSGGHYHPCSLEKCIDYYLPRIDAKEDIKYDA